MIECKIREHLIRDNLTIPIYRKRRMRKIVILVNKRAQGKKTEGDDHHYYAEPENIPLCLADGTHAEILLHHILVKAGHGDCDKNATKKLLQEKIAFQKIEMK